MINETTLLASIAFLIADTLQDEYQIDAAPIIAKLEIDPNLRLQPGTRLPVETIDSLWCEALAACGDPCLGIRVGRRVSPVTYYVLGHAWYASQTLREAVDRMIRYNTIVDSAERESVFEKRGDSYYLSDRLTGEGGDMPIIQWDAAIAAFVTMCELVKGRPVRLEKVELVHGESNYSEAYDELFNAPVEYGAECYALTFPADEMEEPLETAMAVIAEAADEIALRYIDSLDKNKIAAQVRALLIQMLPSGSADQESVASRLYRSSSTLQRQLSAEGTSYRDVLKSTRRRLAKKYLGHEQHSHTQIAYLLGFSDQSNFARAFKRWTGQSPGQYQKGLA